MKSFSFYSVLVLENLIIFMSFSFTKNDWLNRIDHYWPLCCTIK